MLKLPFAAFLYCLNKPAAFGRLCVETKLRKMTGVTLSCPAAFGRLCVETAVKPKSDMKLTSQPPSGGCVLKRHKPKC